MDVLNQQVTSTSWRRLGIVGRAMSAREVKLRIDALRFRNLACSNLCPTVIAAPQHDNLGLVSLLALDLIRPR